MYLHTDAEADHGHAEAEPRHAAHGVGGAQRQVGLAPGRGVHRLLHLGKYLLNWEKYLVKHKCTCWRLPSVTVTSILRCAPNWRLIW